eukprot:SM000005S17108  [mRNA]  locus=s5:191804:194416:+ [translate_table: standard]
MVGMGVLAGSTIMILTVAWAGSLLLGRCDLAGPGGTAVDGALTPSAGLAATGVTTDAQTPLGARIMLASALPFVIAQVPLLDGHPAEGPEAALAGCAVAVLGLVTYCGYQVASPWLQKKRIQEAQLQVIRSRALKGLSAMTSKVAVLGAGGGSLLARVFTTFDRNGDGHISRDELRKLVAALSAEEEGYEPSEQELGAWLAEFDVDADGTLTEEEFTDGLARWAQKITRQRAFRRVDLLEGSLAAGANDAKVDTVSGRQAPDWASKSEDAKLVLRLLEDGEKQEANEAAAEEGEDGPASPSKIYRRAALLLLFGASLVALFADPIVDAIGGLSTATGVPPFFVAFIITPLASNASELVSSLQFARGKRRRNISLTFSQVYGAISMNNTLCLGIFLGLVYARGLTWNFSSEVTVILFTILVLGVLGGSRTTIPAWVAFPVLALYPLSLGGVAALDYLLGWQ